MIQLVGNQSQSFPLIFNPQRKNRMQESQISGNHNPGDRVSEKPLSSRRLVEDKNWLISRRTGFLDFSFTEEFSQMERLTFNGYYGESSQTLSFNLKYVFQKEVMTGSGWQRRSFMLNLSFDRHQVEKMDLNIREQKEDIASYLKRLVEEIIEIANDKDKLLLGAKIDLEEFMEIAAIEDGKFIKMIHSLIQTIFNFTLRKLMEEENEAEPVMVEVERQTSHKLHMDYSREIKNRLNLEIIDITGNGNGQPVEEPPE